MLNSLILDIQNLTVSFSDRKVIDTISFSVAENQIVSVVGESGSGKSITSLAVVGLLPENAKMSGEIWFNHQNISDLTDKQWQQIRGKDIGFVFQEPMSSLNPTLTCGEQVAEVLKKHTFLSKKAIKKEVFNLFERVQIDPERTFRSYPHQLSGGQKQRVMIAMAIACKPKLLIADEPTTALDVSVQKEIVHLLKSIQKETKMSVLFISHDLNLVSEISDQTVVMYQGKVVEKGASKQIFETPQHTYTQALLAARPKKGDYLRRLPTIYDFMKTSFKKEKISEEERTAKRQKIYSQVPLLSIKNVSKTYISKSGFFSKSHSLSVLNDFSLDIYEGETIGLIGASGCGKTTLGRTIVQLEKASSGEIIYKEKNINLLKNSELKNIRKDIQFIFQDPYASLNPAMMVGEAILEPMTVHHVGANYTERKQKVIEILERVGLSATDFYKFPHEFSGGQRQRIGIARALVLSPKIIICDEVVSALDISAQAQVLNLLNDLKENYHLTYIFISHDMEVVDYMSDRIIELVPLRS